MAIKIAVTNQKGGVGKSTTSLCLVDGLHHLGYKCLLIDLDPQCNSTSTYIESSDGLHTIYDVLTDSVLIQNAILSTESGDIIPGDRLLPTIESQLNARMDRYNIVKKKLAAIDGEYDFIVFDTPPNLGLFMLNAITAADGCVNPIRADKFAVDGLTDLFNTLNDARENVNPNLKDYGVLLTDYNKSRSLDRDIWELLPEMSKNYGFKYFSHPIRTSQEIKKAQSLRASLFDEFPKSNGAVDYASVIEELLKEAV